MCGAGLAMSLGLTTEVRRQVHGTPSSLVDGKFQELKVKPCDPKHFMV